jgi:predicted nucleotidyltransferase
MNRKQETALRTIADWADRFECVKGVVLYGSVARGDERADSDLDVDLEFVADLTTHTLLPGQRAKEAIVVATGAPREAGCPAWVVLGVKAIEAPGVRAA